MPTLTLFSDAHAIKTDTGSFCIRPEQHFEMSIIHDVKLDFICSTQNGQINAPYHEVTVTDCIIIIYDCVYCRLRIPIILWLCTVCYNKNC